MQNFLTINIQKIQENLKSGITVAMVSIPLSIAISIASGAGPVPGIITGFWATMIAAMFGGSKYNVVGPAGALTSVLFAATVHPVLVNLGASTLSVIALISGLMILLAYVLDLGKYIKHVPESVVHGFAAGVAFVIASTQLREALGIAHTFKPVGEFFHDMQSVINNISSINYTVFATFVMFFIFLNMWKKKLSHIPGVIPASILGIILGLFSKSFELTKNISTIGDRYGDLQLELVNFLDFGKLNLIFSDLGFLFVIMKISAIVALISLLETLITAKMGDKLTNTEFDASKETRGLSLANIFSGIFGGLPATGVFIITGLNIKSGGTDRHSMLITGFITGVGAIFLMPVFKYIQMSVIAAILMMTALGLMNLSHFMKLKKESKLDFFIAIFTALLVIIFDPLVAVLSGTILYYVNVKYFKLLK